jgi:hypothetical protein
VKLKRLPQAIKLPAQDKTWSCGGRKLSELDKIEDRDEYLAALRRTLPAARLIVYLSLPGLSQDAKTAYVRAAVMPTDHGCYRGRTLFLALKNGAWTVTKDIDTWIE